MKVARGRITTSISEQSRASSKRFGSVLLSVVQYDLWKCGTNMEQQTSSQQFLPVPKD